MKNQFIIFIFILLLIPSVFASMSFQNFDSNYRLGDSISPILSVQGDYDGFLSVNLVCDESFSYYYSPLSVSSASTITLPTLKIVSGMEGSCFLDSKVESFSKEIIDSTKSPMFDISSKLNINIVSVPETVSPFENIEILLNVNSESFTIEGRNFDFKKVFDKNEISFSFPSIKESGYFEYRFTVKDSFGNLGTFTIPILVKSIPSSLKLNLNKNSFNHEEVLEVSSSVLDQSSKIMNSSVSLYFLDKTFNDSFTFPLNYLSPGKYEITAVFENFKEIRDINIFPSRNILFAVKNESLLIKNLGNTYFDESFEVVLSSDKTFLLSEKIVLSPNSSKLISLNSVPSGYYNISISKLNKEGIYEENLNGVYLSDYRNLVTKLNQGIDFLTGNMVVDLNWNANVYFLFIFIIFLILIFYFSNWRFKKSLKKVFTDLIVHHKVQTETLTNTLNSTINAKKRLERAFSRHVDPSVIKELISTDDLEGKKQEITVLYADIRGFTKLSEDEDVWFIINLLNSYFEKLGMIVKKYNGIIDKYIGDSLMALFNAPIKRKDHELSAIKCALEIQEVIKNFNRTLEKKGKNKISVGIGINSGNAVVGFIGSSSRLEYTAIGDVVNVAARLESKSSGVLITKEIYSKLSDKITARPLGYLEFKNVRGKIYCYDVLGLKK